MRSGKALVHQGNVHGMRALLISGKGGQSEDGTATQSLGGGSQNTEDEIRTKGRKAAIIYGRLHGSFPVLPPSCSCLSPPQQQHNTTAVDSVASIVAGSRTNNEFSWYFHGFVGSG